MAGENPGEKHVAACPKCRSKDISAEPVGIEFTKMACGACGHMDVADVWDRAEWYSEARKVCSICRAIPRDGNWPIDETLAKFGIIRETFASDRVYVKCPECGITYWYSYNVWLEDWQSESSFAFTRLDIAQTLESLPAGERAAYAEQIPAIVDDLELDLFHADSYVRAEAAWKLTRYYNINRLWDKLQRLLINPKEDIFAEAFLQSFRKPQESDDPEPTPAYVPHEVPASLSGPAMLRGLRSENQQIKDLAASGLCQAAIDASDSNAIVQILQSRDVHVAEHTLWYLTYKAQVLNVKPLREILVQYVKSGNTFQATCGLKILRRGREDGADPVPPFAFIVDCLKHKKTEIRKEAVDQLFTWAASKEEKQQALKILVSLLNDKLLSYNAMEQLKNQAEFGEPGVSVIIPEIIAYVKQKRQRWEAGMEILRYAMEKNSDISGIFPFIAKGIAAGSRRVIESSYVMVDRIIGYEMDVSALQKDFEKGLQKMQADYYGGQLVKLLVGIYLRGRDTAAVNALLSHTNSDVVRFTAAALKEAEAK